MNATCPEITFVVETIHLRPEEGVEDVARALETISRQTVAPERYEVLVTVDPLRHPRLRGELALAAPHVRVLECPGAHNYAQKNAAAREARGEILGFVDCDCDPVPGWAEAVLDAFARSGPDCSVVAGRYVSGSSAGAVAYLVTTFGNQIGRAERRVPTFGASNCAFRREELRARPYREDPVYHGPDVEKAAEIRAAGRYILYVPGAASSHEHVPGLRAQHFKGVYWGYCFLKLRRAGTGRARDAGRMRAVGPLAPRVVAPAKAWIDLRRLAGRRADFGLGAAATVRCAALLALNAISIGIGAARCVAGRPTPAPPAGVFAKRPTIAAAAVGAPAPSSH
jgi:hypothetical protein